MDEHIENNSVARTAEEALSFWERHRLSLLLIITVIVAITMTSISVAIYNSSGAAQLDLSRPGYLSVSDKVQTNDDINTYSASGAVNKETIEEFIKLYDAQVSKAMKVDAFNGDPLNPEVLEFGTPSNQ
jgi:hypothetical protein